MHVAAVAEADAQHHGVLAGRTVSLGNQVSDAHSRSETISLFTPFNRKTGPGAAGLRAFVCVWCVCVSPPERG